MRVQPGVPTARSSSRPPVRHRRRTWVAGVAVALTAAACALLAPPPAARADDPRPSFTIVAIPDTQSYTKSATNYWIMGAQTQWVVDHRADLGTQFVVQLGDLVEWEDRAYDWGNASQYMATLDAAGVPSSVVPGNHDMDLPTGGLTHFAQSFPPSRYQSLTWTPSTTTYGGYLGQNQFGPDPVDRGDGDSYSLFSAAGMDFLVLNLEYNPPDYAIDWAKRVLAAYPDRRTILVTHSYLDLTGSLSTQVLRQDGLGNSGQALWNKLVSTSCQIFLVLNGHFYDGDQGEARRTDTNTCGKPVLSALSDYQARANGGDGWLRYYTFEPDQNAIEAYTYSPTLGQFETDADSRFTLPYDMGGTGTPPAPTTVAADDFERTVTSGWGSAATGGPWSLAGTSTRYGVAGGVGRQAVPPGATLTSTLATVSSTSTDLRATLALDRVPDQASYVTVSGRLLATSDYGARLKIMPNGTVQLAPERSGTVLGGGTLPGVTLAGGTRLHVRVLVDGTSPTTIRTKAWLDGTTEPATWQYTATDSTAALQAPGGIRLSTYLSGTATGGALTASWDDLSAVPVGGTPPPPPPPNQPPVAAFTPTTSGLGVSVDGTASRDPDGTVASWAWTFGDGGTATGSTASHTYAAAGTYAVTLTVTDDDGAPSSTTQQVTVTAPPPASTVAADAFARTVSSGWGSADVGGAWALNGTASRYSVAGGTGRVVVPTGSTMTAALAGATSTAVDVVATVAVDRQPDVTAYLALSGRVVGANDYAVRLKLAAGGTVQASITRSGTALTAVNLPGTLTPGTAYHLRIQAQGTGPTTLRAKAWKDGSAEPSAWTTTTTDATAALQSAGSFKVMGYLSSGSANGPLTMSWGPFTATALP